MKFSPQNEVLRSAILVLALVLMSPSAFAYLDPSTGSMIVSALIGIFASIALALKTYWYKLRRLIRRRNHAPSDRP